MTEVWTALITGAFTLAAGFGGIMATDWRDSTRGKRDRRHEAYLELMLALDQLSRIWTAPRTLDEHAEPWTIAQATGIAVNRVQVAYFSVFLVAAQGCSRSRPGRRGRRPGPSTSGSRGSLATAGEPADLIDDLKTLLGEVAVASTEFANAARKAEGESLPTPVTKEKKRPYRDR